MTGRKFFGVASVPARDADVGCETCVQRNGCARAHEGTFCGQWRSKEPPEKDPEEDPNRKWEKGEEADF